MTQEKFKKKVEKYIKEENKLLKKHKLGKMPVILFPQNKIPLTGKIAMWFLKRNKAEANFQFLNKD